MLIAVLLIILPIILMPANLYAWGPGTHLEVATTLLKEASLFAPAVAVLMKKYRDAFVYGMVSADVLVGKKYAGYLHHNHNWRVGRQVFERCKTDRERAAAYGYLTHLASDIIAHNYYVPYMIIKSFDTKMMQHAYWELRFDVHVEKKTWEEVKRVLKADTSDFDLLLEKTLKRPMFSYKMNKRIFNTIMLMQQFRQMRNMIALHSRFSQWPLRKTEVKHYKSLIMATARDFLKNPDDAPCLKGDPAGHVRLRYASDTRKALKKYVSRGIVTRREADRFIKKVRGMLRKTIFQPEIELPESYSVL